MVQISRRRRDAFCPTNFPLFQGVGVREISVKTFMACSSIRWRSKNGSIYALHVLRLVYSRGSNLSGRAREMQQAREFWICGLMKINSQKYHRLGSVWQAVFAGKKCQHVHPIIERAV